MTLRWCTEGFEDDGEAKVNENSVGEAEIAYEIDG